MFQLFGGKEKAAPRKTFEEAWRERYKSYSFPDDIRDVFDAAEETYAPYEAVFRKLFQLLAVKLDRMHSDITRMHSDITRLGGTPSGGDD